jgi:release factor glutamine methyltransferase
VDHDRPVNLDERNHFRDLIKRRINGEPTAYITGCREFMSLSFLTDPRVLIPRADTEILVEESITILDHCQQQATVADIGTGSGAIGVSIAYYVPGTLVYAVDAEQGALEVAQANARRHGVDSRMFFLQGHLAEPLAAIRFDLITANLPYIPSGEIAQLPLDVRAYEPLKALDGGRDGLDLYRELIPQSSRLLLPGGSILLEISGRAQAEALKPILETCGFNYYVHKDLGDRDRVLVGRKE